MARMPSWFVAPLVVLSLAATTAHGDSRSDVQRAKELGLVLTQAPPLRQARGGGIIGDCYAHDNVAGSAHYGGTPAHEETHGANSVIRNRHGGDDRCNAMYIGNNLAIVINEPAVPLVVVARYVPGSMRGISFQVCFGWALPYWGNNTLFVFDDWSCYVNGTWGGVERGRVERASALQMVEFTVYAFAAMAAIAANKPDYDLTQMRAAVAWMCERRVLPLLKHPGAEDGARHLQLFKTSQDTASLRQFVRGQFGKAWTKAVLGF